MNAVPLDCAEVMPPAKQMTVLIKRHMGSDIGRGWLLKDNLISK